MADYIPPALAGCAEKMAGPQFAKGRFIGEMYARACYSMLLVSQQGPTSLRIFVRAAALLPPSRELAISLAQCCLPEWSTCYRGPFIGNCCLCPRSWACWTWYWTTQLLLEKGGASSCHFDLSALPGESFASGTNDCGTSASGSADGNGLAIGILARHSCNRPFASTAKQRFLRSNASPI